MAKLKIKPLADRVLIEPAKAETTTVSGIIIPDTAQEKPQKGIVVAVGNGTKDHKMSVKKRRPSIIWKILRNRIKI
jgi:chaperonin GroES